MCFLGHLKVPQFILEEAYERRQYCKIICTQPRRIAAISMAKRVSKERKWPEGTVVGYQVSAHPKSLLPALHSHSS